MTSSRLSGNALIAQATSGLYSNYYYLSMLAGKDTLTLDNILHPDMTNSNPNVTYLNSTFAQYMAKNFNYIDKDGDGTISSADLQTYTTQLSTQGLTYNQLAQLCSQNGTNSLLETVLNNFDEIDANGDGRVTSAEISAYGIEQEADEMKENYPKCDLKAMSVFYTTSASSTSSSSDD